MKPKLLAVGVGRTIVSTLAASAQDAVFAVRLFRRQPGIVLVTVIGLAVAIGFSTFAFSLISAQLLRPLGVRDPSSLYRVETAPGRMLSVWPYSDYVQLRENSRLIGLEASIRTQATLSRSAEVGGGDSVQIAFVSEGFLEMMGGRATSGRLLGPADHRATSSPTVVVNHALWMQRFAGDESIVGSVVSLSGEAFTIVGVADRLFGGPTPSPPAFWAPLVTYGNTLGPRRASLAPGNDLSVSVYGRLGPGTSRGPAETELSAVAASILEERGETDELLRPSLLPADIRSFGPGAAEARFLLTVVLGVIALVLSLACANIASLLLASAIARQREVGIRMALGASRGRIVRQMVTESTLLSLVGGAVGLLLATWVLSAVGAALPTTPVEPTPDFRVCAFVALASILTGLIAGLAPARYGAHGDIASPLSGGVATLGGSRGPRRTRSLLVGAQAAVSTVILVVAGLLTAAAFHLARFDTGLDIDHLVTVSAPLRSNGYDAARAAAYWENAGESVTRLPGVDRVALVLTPPFAGGFLDAVVRRGGRRLSVGFNYTTADWFATAGLRLIRGRGYTAEEVAAEAPVVVITESVADDLWGGEDALGATLERVHDNLAGLPPFWVGRLSADLAGARVIGIVANATTNLARGTLGTRTIYLPLAPVRALEAKLMIRTSVRAAELVGPVYQAVRAIDPEFRPTAGTVRDDFQRYSGDIRVLAWLAGTTGGVSLALAITGIFGLAAFIVERRSAEIGLRMAVGASVGDVVRLMIRDSLRPVLLGVTIGIAVAPGLGRLMEGLLYGVSGYDLVPVLGSASVLVAAAALAALIPARRAARVDPVVALRHR